LALAAGPPRQPIPFSHKQHAAVAACELCHATAAASERAGLPPVAQCMACHEGVKKDSQPIRRLAGYHKDTKPIPWVRIYQVPDYVIFSHARHAAGKLDCAACHGPVAQREALGKEAPTDMKACMDCHQSRGATLVCSACHELGH
jgi:hypothetical protein